MSFATDNDQAGFPLSPNGMRMLSLRDEVFGLWEKRVQERLVEARSLPHPILIDTLPAFYDNIAQSISPLYPRSTAVEGTTVASEHGGERARVTSYDHTALIEEYQILRWSIFEVLHCKQVILSHEEMHAINASLDGGIQEAIEAFTLMHSGFRERFAAALAHDLRGPMTAALTGLEVLLLTNDQAKMKTLGAKAIANIQRMSGMVDELLDTMAFHGGKTMQLSLSEFDSLEVIKEVHSDAVAAHGLRMRCDALSVRGWWDRDALQRVIENLVSNAVKYGHPHTPVTIQSRETHGRLVLSVHNEGPPIPPQEQESIFQMYRRAEAAKHGSKEGWGIGLPYVRAVTESHGGSIGLDSSAERGTTFVIDIPLDGRPYHNSESLAQG